MFGLPLASLASLSRLSAAFSTDLYRLSALVPPTVGGTKADSLFKSLVNAAESILKLAKDAQGRPNKTLQSFTDDLNRLIKKYR